MIGLSLETRSSGTVVSVINFNAGGYKLLDGFCPQTEARDQKVTEQFDILIKGASDSDLETRVRAVELALDFAKSHPAGPDGVWILFSPRDTTLTAWQSRVSGGALVHGPDLNRYWKNSKVVAQVIVERAAYWESEEPAVLELTNRAGSSQASADIVNHQDGGATDDLYVEIAADQVTGVLPTPAIIEYKNTVNDAVLVDHLTVGHFAACGANAPPTAGSLIFEGDVTADAACSGGKYATLTWADALENSLITWSLASGAFRQKNYKVLARLKTAVAYTDLWLQARLLMGTKIIAETRWMLVEAGDELITIGSMQIPPFRFGSAIDLGNLSLVLYEKRVSGAGSINLDYVATIPQDSWRRLGAITGLAYNETLLDDPVNDLLVTAYGGSHKVTHKVDEGGPVMLQPGVKNVLYFLHDTTTGTAPIERTANVVVKIHPRRLTV